MNECSAAGRAERAARTVQQEPSNGIVMQATREAHVISDRLAKVNTRLDSLRSRVFGPLPEREPSNKDTVEPNSDMRRLEEAFDRLRHHVAELEDGIEAIEQI